MSCLVLSNVSHIYQIMNDNTWILAPMLHFPHQFLIIFFNWHWTYLDSATCWKVRKPSSLSCHHIYWRENMEKYIRPKLTTHSNIYQKMAINHSLIGYWIVKEVVNLLIFWHSTSHVHIIRYTLLPDEFAISTQVFIVLSNR